MMLNILNIFKKKSSSEKAIMLADARDRLAASLKEEEAHAKSFAYWDRVAIEAEADIARLEARRASRG